MRLPTPLLRHKFKANKYDFGHVLVIAGSSSMLGAAALTSLATMRMGAGIVTCAVPLNLNPILQKKISPEIMTLPLPETRTGAYSYRAFQELYKIWDKFDALVIGPGLALNKDNESFILRVIQGFSKPMVIDAGALSVIAVDPAVLLRNDSVKILTPHAGEMARLTKLTAKSIEINKAAVAKKFAKQFHCICVLKGHRSVIASWDGKCVTNTTGGSAMAKAGCGDVLSGMIAALLAQGVPAFDAASFAVYYHGHIADKFIQGKNKHALIASDIIQNLLRPLGR